MYSWVERENPLSKNIHESTFIDWPNIYFLIKVDIFQINTAFEMKF